MKNWLVYLLLFFLWTCCTSQNEPCAISLTEMERRKIEVERKWDELVSENILYVPRGGSVGFTCKTGYRVATNASQSASVIHCNGDSIVYPECKEIVCSPPQVENGDFQPKQIQYTYRSAIETVCEYGTLYLESYCTETGWSPPPTCNPKNCDYFWSENGHITDFLGWWREYTFQSRERKQVVYICHDGFVTRFKRTYFSLRCTESGWRPEPKCFRKRDIPGCKWYVQCP